MKILLLGFRLFLKFIFKRGCDMEFDTDFDTELVELSVEKPKLYSLKWKLGFG